MVLVQGVALGCFPAAPLGLTCYTAGGLKFLNYGIPVGTGVSPVRDAPLRQSRTATR